MENSELNLTPEMKTIIHEAAQIMGKAMNEEINPKEWLSPDEAMELLNCKRTTLYSFCNEGRLTYSQVNGKGRLYNRKSILKYIESKKVLARRY